MCSPNQVSGDQWKVADKWGGSDWRSVGTGGTGAGIARTGMAFIAKTRQDVGAAFKPGQPAARQQQPGSTRPPRKAKRGIDR